MFDEHRARVVTRSPGCCPHGSTSGPVLHGRGDPATRRIAGRAHGADATRLRHPHAAVTPARRARPELGVAGGGARTRSCGHSSHRRRPYAAGHRGIDVRASGGIVSRTGGRRRALRGVVVDRPVLSIRHPGGLISSYEPVEIALTAGEAVRRGDVIGTVVAGHCASDCLHFGVRLDGQYVSPLNYLGGSRTPCCCRPAEPFRSPTRVHPRPPASTLAHPPEVPAAPALAATPEEPRQNVRVWNRRSGVAEAARLGAEAARLGARVGEPVALP